ncbi:SDR family NAD(P)-dependent oxidoreductase [Pseudohoeflea suaedae]|uniref:SDR family NAD(P)-dependent oxidoreductase n=1 Tax=Pseudohoeflea suaedae TaxID=877384 RepID=A0A4R5PIE9_9HYPH|nr:SDR family oxidoreductase [Pseudohoeflea suaedae]TDH34305.1 SDR family NAD(P)-dependent oxidoreductase [Pseudohoeflea suaedae]
MKMTGNTILITGGNGGIGRALAEAFLAKGNEVIVTGRDKAKLEDVVSANPGIHAMELDVADPKAIEAFAQKLTADFPALNVVINNAGIMRPEEASEAAIETAEATVATNLLGPIRLTTALLPHLLGKDDAAVLTVSSGLAFVPRATFPTYCATKAAIHSWSMSLNHQLAGTSVQVIELAPPYVQTQLTGAHQASDPNAMPLADYISETMQILESEPDAREILVSRVQPLRWAERDRNFQQVFGRLNG